MTHIGISSPRNSQLLTLCLIALWTLLPSLASAEDIYKWTGDDGKINYTQMPPPSGYPSELVKQNYLSPGPPRAVESATKSPQARLSPQERLKALEKDKENEAAKAEREKENAEIMRFNCDAASRNLAALEQNSQRVFRTSNGETMRPTEEERKKLIDKARQQVKDYCIK